MILLLFITTIYAALLFGLAYGFRKVPDFELSDNKPVTHFTIVVPFRNEKENLPQLLESFSRLDYPLDLFEVILVDDGSTDGFRLQDSGIKITVVENVRKSGSPKKDAILTSINLAANDWILTTDADCTVNPGWLKTLDAFLQTSNAEMVAGSVSLDFQNTFLNAFQQLDFAGLQGATIGSFGIQKAFMCNGANLAYSKRFFAEIGGFQGNENMASGDDVFLLQKAVAQFPEKVKYLRAKPNIVQTKAAQSWRELFRQRQRWAAKASGYQSVFGKMLALVVLAGNLAWVFGFWIWVLDLRAWKWLALLTLLKFSADYVLVGKAARFLGNRNRYFLLSAFVYPFFSVAVGLFSVFGSFDWKGRTFRK